MEMELTSLCKIHNSFTWPISILRWEFEMVNCPKCGKPLRKGKHKSKYYCENSACSVIFICHPDKESIMRITYKAKARS
jgi:NADH pyrophosphatase NudC (nudix superfamily)